VEAFLSDRNYAIVKWAVVIVLPAIGTLYFAIASIWGLPSAEQVMGTILALQAFLGVILGISSKSYNASEARYSGDMTMSKGPNGSLNYALELNGHPEDLQHMDEVIFKVKGPK
jgi:Putative phage holin Dp-1